MRPGRTSEQTMAEWETWLSEQPDDRELAVTVARLRGAAGGSGGSGNDEALVASYLRAGKPDAEALLRLVRDPVLRRDVASLARVLDQADQPRAVDRRLRAGVAAAILAAAASLAWLFVMPPAEPVTEHRAATVAAAELKVLTPAGERSARPEIGWETVLSADLYELEVTAADGRPVFTQQTPDTTIRIPDGVLTPGRSYFFRVRARLEAGRWIMSDFRELVVRP